MVASIDKDLAQWPVELRVQVREGHEMLDKVYDMLVSRLALWKDRHDVYPENILVYRDGVSESQYQQVLNEELKEMQKASILCYAQIRQPLPRFTLIIVGKRHHTHFFPPSNHPASDVHGNSNRGLVVDRGITEARNWEFFLQSHTAIKGTARPAHYYSLWDEILTNPRDHVPAPVYYADIACERAGRYLAEISDGSESGKTDKTEMTTAQREELCRKLQEKIKVNKDHLGPGSA